MLDQKTFLQGINYLKANYINWGFDLNNDLMLKVWYKKFSNLEAAVFMQLIEKYTEVSKFPPQSPAELLDLLRDQLAKSEMDPQAAWQEVLGLMRKHGFYYGRDKIYKALEDKPALKQTVEQFEMELSHLMVDDTNTPLRFKNAYAANLKRQVENNSSLLLGTNVNILLLK